jgi:hypothetical protein
MKLMNPLKLILFASALLMLTAQDANSQSNNKGKEPMSNNEMTKESETHQRDQLDIYYEVTEALKPYIEGARTGDLEQLKSAFYDSATMTGIMDNKLMHVNAIETFEQFGSKPSPKLRVHIASIDISGPVAVAKIEFDEWMGMRYTDFLTLVQHNGTWKISAKAFDAHEGSSK